MPDEYFKQRGALCLGKLRLDGFVSLDANEQGTVTTRPFMASGGQLWVNVDAGKGQVSAEVIDAETMEPLTGLSFEDATPLTEDKLRGRLSWSDGAGFSSPKPVRIRFAIDNASLYAFWIE